MSEKEVKTIKPAQMCYPHRYELVHKAKFKEHDPWMALEISATLALTQAALAENKYHIKYGSDPEMIGNVGCLACFCPNVFKKIVATAKEHKRGDFIAEIKKIGDGFQTLVNSKSEG